MGRPITPHVSTANSPEPRVSKSGDFEVEMSQDGSIIEHPLRSQATEFNEDDEAFLAQDSVSQNYDDFLIAGGASSASSQSTQQTNSRKRTSPELATQGEHESMMWSSQLDADAAGPLGGIFVDVSEGIFSNSENVPPDESWHSTALSRRDTIESYTRGPSIHDRKRTDWKRMSESRRSVLNLEEPLPASTARKPASAFKGVRKVLKNLRDNPNVVTFPVDECAELEWIEKTFGVDWRFGDEEFYLNPDEWFFDDITVEVIVKQDIPYAKELFHTVIECSRLETKQQQTTLPDDPDGFLGYINDLDQPKQYHPDLHDALEVLPSGVRLKLDFTGYKALLNHYRFIEALPPFEVVKPLHLQSAGVLGAMTDDINGICSLNLRMIDPNFFETAMRYAALSTDALSRQMRNTLLKAHTERLCRIMRLVQEEVQQIIAEPSFNPASIHAMSGDVAYGPLGSILHTIERNKVAAQGTNGRRPSTSGSSRASIAHRSRRGSIVRGGDENKLAFIQTLTNSERDFYEQYRKQLIPEEKEETRIFDNMIMQMASDAGVSPGELLGLHLSFFDESAVELHDEL